LKYGGFFVLAHDFPSALGFCLFSEFAQWRGHARWQYLEQPFFLCDPHAITRHLTFWFAFLSRFTPLQYAEAGDSLHFLY
jgi:hypothetical protein